MRREAPYSDREPTREELDALALREHIATHPTPPSGPNPAVEISETPAKTTDFYRKDGSLAISLTLGPVTHIVKRYRFPRRRSS